MEYYVAWLRRRGLFKRQGFALGAPDGEIGRLDALYFDDEGWIIRYLAVDTSRWLPGRKVLVSPDAIERVSWAEASVRVALSREAIRSAPFWGPSSPDAERALHHAGEGR